MPLTAIHRAGWIWTVALLALLPCLSPVWADDPPAETDETEDEFGAAKERFIAAVTESDVATMIKILAELKEFDSEENAELLVEHGLPYAHILVQRDVQKIVSTFKDKDARKVVADACTGHESAEARAGAAKACLRYGEYAYGKLREAAKDKEDQVRTEAYRSLAGDRRNSNIDFLIAALKSETDDVRPDVAWALEQLTEQELGDNHKAWVDWWEIAIEGYKFPPAIWKRPKPTNRKSLGTAVRDGLYGPIESKRVAFLLDISGSMRVGADGEKNTRIKIAKEELQRALEELAKDAKFNIITFSDKVGGFSTSGLQKASKSKVNRAIKYVEKLKAAGETNAYGALEAAFHDKSIDTIYLLSDGKPTVGDETKPEEIFDSVASWNRSRNVKIHCIGFFPGSAKNQSKREARAFLEKLSKENGGIYLEIY